MNLQKKIIPAIIAKNQDELDERLSNVLEYFDLIQLDIMDNDFVPNQSLFFDFELPVSKCQYEAHLMVANPDKWIDNNWEKVDLILVHYESCGDPRNIISKVKEVGKKIGFVLNPETQIQVLEDIIDDINQVLIMTVKPGFYGSPFIPEMKDKIKQLRELKTNLDIEVDGGITPDTIKIVDVAGANMFVSGSYLVKSDDVKEAILNLQKKLNGF